MYSFSTNTCSALQVKAKPCQAPLTSPLSPVQIEEGGKADSLPSKLQAGDEVVNINEVELSSSRREAISLVKGSYKKLKLIVRR